MNIYKIIIGLTVSSILIGCSSDQVPVGTRVRIAPGDKHFNIGSTWEEGMFCFTEGALYQDVPLLISVTDPDNAPVGRAEVSVYADFTGNTQNGLPMLELYADHNGNGVIDAPEELVTSSSSGVYKAKTDKYDGTTFLMLRMYLSCPYEGDIFAYVGYSTFSMQVGVSYQSSQTTGGETTGGETTGDTTGGETSGGDTTGGDTTGGDTTGGDTTGGDTTGGDTTGGDTTGGDTTGGDTTGGDTTGGETTGSLTTSGVTSSGTTSGFGTAGSSVEVQTNDGGAGGFQVIELLTDGRSHRG